jgi:hypothetical protein
MSLSGGVGVGDRGSGTGKEERFLGFKPKAEVSVLNLGIGLDFSAARRSSLSDFRPLGCFEDSDHQVLEDDSSRGGWPEDISKERFLVECWQDTAQYRVYRV